MINRNQAFTLIELIIVIVLLGILAATALPRFINFSSSSQIAVLKQVGAALGAYNSFFYQQSVLQKKNSVQSGCANDSNRVEINGVLRYNLWGNPYFSCDPSHLGEVINMTINAGSVTTSDPEDVCAYKYCVVKFTGTPSITVMGNLGYPNGTGEGEYYPGDIMIILPKDKKVNDYCFAYYAISNTGGTPKYITYSGAATSGC